MGAFLFEPLIEIKYLDITLPDLSIYDGVITTSIHAKASLPYNYPCYDIGDYAPTAKELVNRVIRDNQDKNLRLLYIRGADISFDMKEALSQYHVDELISYEAVAIDCFSNELVESFKNNGISTVIFFSKRTSEIFVRLAVKHDVMGYLGNIKALCISDSMVECLYPVFGNNIEVSNSPDAQAMARMMNSKGN